MFKNKNSSSSPPFRTESSCEDMIKHTFLLFIFTFLLLLPIQASAYSIGNPNAPVKVIEYSDYQCPWCRKFELNTLPYIYKNFIKKGSVYWVFRDYPLVNIHAFAYKAAKYADCSGKFYMKMRYTLYKYQGSWDKTGDIYAFLKSKDFPYAKSINACAHSNYPVKMIKRDMALGDSIGISATPVFLIYQNGQYQEKVQGYYGQGYWESTLSLLMQWNF